MERIKEGDLYKTVIFQGKIFTLFYGYYEPYERNHTEPIPIYPDFIKKPLYNDEGYPIVTQMQMLCEYGNSKFSDGFCADCRYFQKGTDLFGLCLCQNNKKSIESDSKGVHV